MAVIVVMTALVPYRYSSSLRGVVRERVICWRVVTRVRPPPSLSNTGAIYIYFEGVFCC